MAQRVDSGCKSSKVHHGKQCLGLTAASRRPTDHKSLFIFPRNNDNNAQFITKLQGQKKEKKKNLQQCWHAELNTVKNDLLLAGIKALQEGRISIRRVTITELLISSLGLLSGPFSHFINELSLGYLQGSPTHSWFIMCNMVNRRGMGAEGGGGRGGRTTRPRWEAFHNNTSHSLIVTIIRLYALWPRHMNTGVGNFANKQMKAADLKSTFKARGWWVMETLESDTVQVMFWTQVTLLLLWRGWFWCFFGPFGNLDVWSCVYAEESKF